MLDWLTHYIQPLSWIAGAMAATVFVLRALVGAWRLSQKASEFFELKPTIEQIGKEFNTNGGSSLKDQLNRVEMLAQNGHDVAVEARTASEKTQAALESLQKMVLEEETQTRVTRRVRAR